MDNASIHHIQEVTDLNTATEALIRFLPPYSPDLNPIELAFSKVKAFLKANDTIFQATHAPCVLVGSAFSTITQEDCACRIYTSLDTSDMLCTILPLFVPCSLVSQVYGNKVTTTHVSAGSRCHVTTKHINALLSCMAINNQLLSIN